MTNKLARGNTSLSSSPSRMYSSIASADSGRICMMATFTKRAPAKVVPMALRKRLLLKVASRRGSDPTIMTMRTNRTIKAILSMARIVVYSIIDQIILNRIFSKS